MRSLVIFLFCSTAHAQVPREDDEPVPRESMPGAPVAPGVPDAVFRAVGERPVILLTRGGQLTGKILMVDPMSITLAVLPSQTVMVLPRAEIVELRLAQPILFVPPPATTAVVAAPAEPPPRPRHFALNLGIPPAIDLDLDYGLFYGFLNCSLVFPAASGGDWAGFATGAGLNFALARNSGWKMEVFAQLTPMYFDSHWSVGLGVGFGFHYTFRSGFTLGFKAPVIGYSFTDKSYTSGSQNVALYYLSYAIGSPIMSLGYRF